MAVRTGEDKKEDGLLQGRDNLHSRYCYCMADPGPALSVRSRSRFYRSGMALPVLPDLILYDVLAPDHMFADQFLDLSRILCLHQADNLFMILD